MKTLADIPLATSDREAIPTASVGLAGPHRAPVAAGGSSSSLNKLNPLAAPASYQGCMAAAGHVEALPWDGKEASAREPKGGSATIESKCVTGQPRR